MSGRSYIDAMADAIVQRTPPALLPDDAEDLRGLFRLYALLAFCKGEAVSASDVHDAWVVWMLDRGEEHESLVPFEALSADVKREDAPFVEAIRAALEQSSDPNT